MNRKGRNDPHWRAGEAIEAVPWKHGRGLWGREYKAWLESRRKPEPVRIIMKDGVLIEPETKPKTP